MTKDNIADIFDKLEFITKDREGITRLAYTGAETAALEIIEQAASKMGLNCVYDKGRNLIITVEGEDATDDYIACGSHMDSVAHGGNFDGAAGVLAGLYALDALKDVKLKHSIKLFALRGEESARFGRAYAGSLALLGELTLSDLASKDTDGISLKESMESCGIYTGLIEKGVPLIDKKHMKAWLELHIEQGPLLVAKDVSIGIVTGIRGNIRHRKVECFGETGHSGAVPPSLRHDAVFAVAELINNLDKHWKAFVNEGKDLVVTCGVLSTNHAEHGLSKIPGYAVLSIDIRSLDDKTLEEFYKVFERELKDISTERGVEFKIDRRLDTVTSVLDEKLIEVLEKNAVDMHLEYERLPSGAGHDAAVFASAGVPAAMIFIRNRGGSHNPLESMELDDFIKGADLLTCTLKDIANGN